MKNKKILPISIATIILVAFLALSFLLYDASNMVYIAGIKGSYAETYANENKVDFIELYDSENPDVEIPKIKEEAQKKQTNKKEDTKSTVEKEEVKAEKENAEFAYNYEGKTINVMMYKGSDNIVIVPKTIDNLPVTKLSMNVLNRGILAVYIPESVTAIDTAFTTPRYTPAFYAAVAVMIVGYVFALAGTFIGLKKSETAEGTFYGIPFVYSGLATFIGITVWCAVAISLRLSWWVQSVVALVIFALALIKLLKKSTARAMIEQRGEQVKAQTAFIKLLTADAETLCSNAKLDEAKALAKKVYESIRYSDPMSVPELMEIEAQIQSEFNAFSEAIKNDDTALAESSSEELITLVNERNKKCKFLK